MKFEGRGESAALGSQMTHSIRVARRLFEDSDKSLNLFDSSIFTRNFPGTAAHVGEFRGIAAQLANRGGHRGRIIRVGRQAASGFDYDARGVACCSSDGEYRSARREN